MNMRSLSCEQVRAVTTDSSAVAGEHDFTV